MGRKQKKLPIHYCSRTSTTLPPPLFFSTFERKREGKKETAEKQRGTKVPPPTPLYCLPWCFPFKEMINEKNTIIGFAQINSQHPEKNSEICFIIQKEKKKKKKKREKKFSPFFFFFFFLNVFIKTDTQTSILLSHPQECNLRSRFWWFAQFCNSHYVSHFAALFIIIGTKISVVESNWVKKN